MYLTADDMVERFGEQEMIQLTDRVNMPPTTVDTGILNAAIGDASALADSYISSRYSLPLSSTPSALARQVGDVARYYLFGSRADVGGTVERSYKDALAWLTNVAKGVVKLDLPDGELVPASSGSAARVQTGCAVFTSDFRRF